MQLPAAIANLPRKQQLMVFFGIPVAIALLFLFLIYSALGTLGQHYEAVTDPTGELSGTPLPGFLQRETDPSVGADIVHAEDDIRTKKVIADQLPAVQAELNSLTKEKELLEARLPRQAEKALIRENIEQLAREILPAIGSVRLLKVRINEGQRAAGGGRGKADYQPITYECDLEGDMNGIIEYVRAIEQNERFMTVHALTVRGGGVKVDALTKKIEYAPHAVRMDIRTYVYTPATKGGSK